MASRRPVALAAPTNRSRSVNSKPLSSSQLTIPVDRKTVKEPDVSSTNIQVAVRCRRRSAREVEEKSAVVVSIPEAQGTEITVELAAPTSTFGVVTLPPTRTYSFDTVFGPDADQATLYQAVVAPMLSEVLLGYNCTLFAYGQTGTGKTYTMQGDLQLTPLGNPVANAGMMPRVLINLFQYLEEGGTDFSVKISYLELYNEELRDLLSDNNDTGDSSSFALENAPSLKIYDDAKKGGVIVQGIEEVPVRSAVHAIAQLTKGSLRRQVAATKFNDHSSRSHAIFTLTVHMKERTAIGDDVLRVGKFNLVDLAGSENIGRSGAESKRAREAGMINQSLLTLGRVITALVEKSSHVPYRESKLTRLLQDSLGGRTKTKLIATVSPARCNVEETLSTLEYAMSAKSIHNRPEMNQRMSRNALLKDYVTEIERLKADLVSAREKNGMFLSSETWDQLSAEKEQMQLECEGAKQRCDAISSQLNALREEFEQSMAILVQRDEELASTKSTLEDRTTVLRSCEKALASTQKALEEETIVVQAYSRSEQALNGVANDLHKNVVEAVSDLDSLFTKLEHKSSECENRLELIGTEAQSIDTGRHSVAVQILQVIEAQSQYLGDCTSRLEEISAAGQQFLAAHSKILGDSRSAIGGFIQASRSSEDRFTADLQHLQDAMKELTDRNEHIFLRLTKGLGNSSTQLLDKIGGIALTSGKIICDVVNTMSNLTKDIMASMSQALDEQDERRFVYMQEQKNLVNHEINRLKKQNKYLQGMIHTQQEDWTASQEVLLRQVGQLLSQFADQRHQQFVDVAARIRSENDQTRLNYLEFTSKSQTFVDQESNGVVELRGVLKNKQVESDELSSTVTGQIRTLEAEMRASSSAAGNLFTSDLSKAAANLRGATATLIEDFHPTFDRMDNEKRFRLDNVMKVSAYLEREDEVMQGLVDNLTDQNGAYVTQLQSSLDGLRDSVGALQPKSIGELDSISQSASRILESCSSKSAPTGNTPRKRKWQFASEWQTAGTREAILSRHQRRTRGSGISFGDPPQLAEGDDAHPPAFAVLETVSSSKRQSTPLQSPTPCSDAEEPSSLNTTPAVSPGKDRPRLKGLRNRPINTMGLGPHNRFAKQGRFFSGGK